MESLNKDLKPLKNIFVFLKVEEGEEGLELSFGNNFFRNMGKSFRGGKDEKKLFLANTKKIFLKISAPRLDPFMKP